MAAATPVYVNVYDLTPMNAYVYWCGLGIYHSGLEAHGVEYAFGAHDHPSSGVFEVEPRNTPGFTFRESILMGTTELPGPALRALVEAAAAEYAGNMYHLVGRNCNHFTDDVCSRLLRRRIPGWINRLARLAWALNCLLPEGLQVPQSAVKRTPEYHAAQEDLPGVPIDDADEDDEAPGQQLLRTPNGEMQGTMRDRLWEARHAAGKAHAPGA
eukprot:SM000040S14759  [mRNA]  locus=s40:133592:134673:- [translate_table: standard]